MILTTINRVIRNRIKTISFPKLSTKEYNNLWKITINKFIKLPLVEYLPILRVLSLKFGASSLIAIPTIFYIIKSSEILQPKETETHLKMFKALDVDNNNIEYFFKVSLIFSLIIKLIYFVVWLLWLPLKIALIFYILDYLGFDISYLYYKLNNLSLGILNWYYQTLIDFLESIILKYDLYTIQNEHITKI
jgi:hypothetical protein